MLSKIVGLEIEITSLTGKAKLSQNREARDRLNAAETLAARGHGELAEAMRTAGGSIADVRGSFDMPQP